MSAFEVRVVDAGLIASDWEDLAGRVNASPFVRPGWIYAWHGAFGRGRLVALTVRSAGRLVAMLPLEVRRGVIRSPTNWHTPDYEPLAENEESSSALLEAALGGNRRRLQLAFVSPRSADAVARRAAGRDQTILSRVLEESPYIDIDGSFADYENRLGRHLRSELARRRRRLSEQGPVSLDVMAKADSVALEQFFRVEAAGWKGQRGSAIATEPGTQRFYTEVARWGAERGWLRLAILRVGDRPVAGDLCLQCGSVHFLLKTGFDPAYRRFAPGKLLRHAMVERAFAEHLRSYEFLGTDETWKLEWTTATRPRLVVQAFGRTVLGRIDHLAFAYARPVAKGVQQRARAWLAS